MMHTAYSLLSYTNPHWQGMPTPIEDYQAFGFRRQGAERWRRHWIPAHLAKQYAELGLSPVEANHWAVVPALVEAYLDAGVHDLTVREWVARGIMPSQARLLIESGACERGSHGYYLPPGSRPIDESEEDYVKWYDGFDQCWDDIDWPEPEEPHHPHAEHYHPDDERHPYSGYDPFDPETVDDPYAAGEFVDDLEREAPDDAESPWAEPGGLGLVAEGASVPSTSVSNVVPLFPSHRREGQLS
jgi:hypothetical protein